MGPSWANLRVIQAGTPVGLPGYSVGADGKLVIEDPFRRRVFNCLEQRLNASFSWQALPTKRVMQMVKQGELDLAFPMGFTAERAATTLQSEPTWDNPDVWLSLKPLNTQDKSLRLVARLGSPQQLEYVGEGYARMTGAISYTELPKTLTQDMADAAIVPRSIFEESKAQWPQNIIVTVGRHRSTGFYVQPNEGKALLTPLNRAITECRAAVK